MMIVSIRFLRGGARCVLFCLASCLIVGPISAQSSHTVNSVKKATAFVKVKQTGMQGSAFCISTQGYFATCAHVVDGVAEGENVTLVLNSGVALEKEVLALVVRKSPELDLAILKTDAREAPALKFGSPSKLKETEAIMVSGFPLGDALAFGRDNPAATISTGKITSVRSDGKTVGRIQIDAKLNPGNSGGPVVNKKGEVVGVAVSTIVGSNLNFAIGTDHLNLLIKSARVEVDKIEPISYGDRGKPLEVGFELDYLVPSSRKTSVKAYFLSRQMDDREIKVIHLGDSKFKVRGVPVTGHSQVDSYSIRASFIQSSGRYTHTSTTAICDQKVTVGVHQMMLSDISMILPSRQLVLGHQGQEYRGVIVGLESIQKLNDQRKTPIAMKNWHAIALRPVRLAREALGLKVVVKDEAYTSQQTVNVPLVGSTSSLMSQGSPYSSGFDPYAGNPELFAQDKREILFDGEIYDVAWGAGGRYLVADIRSQRKLVVVDCAAGQVHGEIPYGAENVTFGAGARQLLIAKGNRVQHWDYEPLAKSGQSAPWVSGHILGLSVGAGASQIVGVYYDAIESAGMYRFEFRDFKTGKLIAIDPPSAGLTKNLHFSSSLTGHAYGAYTNAYSSSGKTMVYYSGQGGMAKGEYGGSGWLSPDPLGQYCYTSFKGAVLAGYQQSSQRGTMKHPAFIPTTMTGLVCQVPMPDNGREAHQDLSLGLYDALRHKSILENAVDLPEFDQSQLKFKFSQTPEDPLTWNKRFFYNAHLGLLCTVPLDNRTLIVRKFDCWQYLKSKGVDYLYPLTYLPSLVSVGDQVTVTLKMASSSQAPLQYELVEGPDGMVLTREGVITWAVDKSAAGMTHPVLIRVRAEGGGEYLLQHKISSQ
ncbi:trypsin-like peptidase domain-containing protein [Verrucomicrobiaceae bacterium N1E253]|uniref:Trypsin-like peptidase domain-containing protein n=1 Tax=Oceaniferula marina TaxID=2748318 RepID=A0A851GI89_9BACT|nr:serine protease [Oceaniferula marina]NWK57233.1 trypsin-like peptidase domain-containing protein [Oceaniferula marina]